MSGWFGFPTLASEHGGRIDGFILLLHGIMAVAFFGWGAWYATALVRFRRGRNPNADYAGLRNRVPYVAVALMAVAEGALLAGIALPFWHDRIAAAEPAPEEFVVRVIGQQFQWNVHYPGPDGMFGRTDPSLSDEVLNTIGLDKDDPASEDDITTLNQLHLPVDRPVVIYLSSRDVIHSMFLPEFRVKQDAIPGMRVPVRFTPTLTSAEFREEIGDAEREFEIACAQLCGINHYTMRGFVTVETQEAFDAWYAAQLDEKRKYSEDDDWWFEN